MTEKRAVISPEGLPQEGARNISRHLDSLDGKIIGEVYNNHFKGELMFRTYRSQFSKKFSNVKVIPFDEFPIVYVGGDPETQKRVAREVAALAKQRSCDAIITGNGG